MRTLTPAFQNAQTCATIAQLRRAARQHIKGWDLHNIIKKAYRCHLLTKGDIAVMLGVSPGDITAVVQAMPQKKATAFAGQLLRHVESMSP